MKTTLKTLLATMFIITPVFAAMPAAKISEATARTTALALVKDGVVKSSELEKEHGTMIYSFDITQPNTPGVEEVQISAYTGKLVNRHHESTKKETAEATKEAAEHKK